MILRVHVQGAQDYEIGDEIWQESLAGTIALEAQTIAGYAGSDLLESPDQAHRDALRDRLIAEMTKALVHIGDEYRAPDDVRYSLSAEPTLEADRLRGVSSRVDEPVVEEVCPCPLKNVGGWPSNSVGRLGSRMKG